MPRVRALSTRQKLERQEERLKAWYFAKLKSNGVKQKDVAELLGVSQADISMRLNGGRVTMRMIVALSSLCDIDAEELKEVLRID